MILSNKRLKLFLMATLAFVGLSACSQTSEAATLTFENLVIQVNDTVSLEPVFTPSSAATSVTYDIEDETIVSISRSGILTGLAEGQTDVVATSQNNLTDTFSVTVNPSTVIPLTSIEQFNEYGTFEEAALPGWDLTGTTAEKQVVGIDVDRAQEDNALTLWTGDFNAADDTASLIDFTMTSTHDQPIPLGNYTLTFEMVGVVNTIEVTLEGQTYTKANKEIVIGGGAYRKSYIEFTLTTSKVISLSMMFNSPGTQTNWGYLDDVKIEPGHIKPELPGEPNDGNYLSDGSFEIAGAQVDYLSADSNEFLAWQIAGDLRNEETVTLNSWTTQGDVSLKYNYYPAAVNTERPIGDMKVFQKFTLAEATTFNLSYYVAAGGVSGTNIYILVDGVEVYTSAVPNAASYTKINLSNIALGAGEVEFGVHYQEDKDTWIHLDYFLLVKPA